MTPPETAFLSHGWIADHNFFSRLDAEDAEATAAVKAGGCPECGGRLDQADFPRKPRGGWVGGAGEFFQRRRSLCCAREGCRHRLTPPSLVFLGRRVYLAITVVVTAWCGVATVVARPPSHPPRRTVRRWLAWFATEAQRTPCLTALRARVSPTLEPDEVLPGARVERFLPRRTVADALTATLRALAPLSAARATASA